MAGGITIVKSGGPVAPKIRPIQKPTSRGVVELGDKALFDHINKGLPDSADKYVGGVGPIVSGGNV